MGRSFRYSVAAEEIKKYVIDLGYEIDDVSYQYGSEPFGFTIRDTTIQVSYDSFAKHPITGDLITVVPGVVSLNNNPFRLGYTPDKADKSSKLYLKLYRRFRARNM